METKSFSVLETPPSEFDKDALLAHLYEQEEKALYYQKSLQKEQEKIVALENRISELLFYLKQAKSHRFGRKSEKGPFPEAPPLNGFEHLFDEPEEIEETITPSISAEKKERLPSGGRKPLPQDLPREETLHDIDKDQKTCVCGHPLHRMGQETSEQLEIIPASVRVRRHVRLKYGCKACEDTIVVAPVPPQPLPKSMASASLLSHILVSKYDDHLPLYRQSEIWQRSGIDLDRATLGRWVIKCAHLLSPLVTLMKKNLLQEDYLQADETTVQVLQEPGRKNTTKSYMWVYKTGGDEKFTVIYDYSTQRCARVAEDFLGDFKGILQSDGYSGYKSVAKHKQNTIKNAGCWAHVRRKFVEITKASKHPTIALTIIEQIKALYAIEKQAKEENLCENQRHTLRQKEAVPLLEKLKKFLEHLQPKVLPKSRKRVINPIFF